MSNVKRVPNYTKNSDKSKSSNKNIHWFTEDTKMCFTKEHIHINKKPETEFKPKREILFSNNLSQAELNTLSQKKNIR